jgi:hypothetical protein
VYDRTFDTYGFKRRASGDCAALAAAAAPAGELGLEARNPRFCENTYLSRAAARLLTRSGVRAGPAAVAVA